MGPFRTETVGRITAAAAATGVQFATATGHELEDQLAILSRGALGGSWRESQQPSAVISVFAVLSITFFPVIADDTNGSLSTVLSLIPLCTPLVMIVRLSIAPVPWPQVDASVFLTAAPIYLVIKVSVKPFCTATLLQGKSPKMREVLQWLREA